MVSIQIEVGVTLEYLVQYKTRGDTKKFNVVWYIHIEISNLYITIKYPMLTEWSVLQTNTKKSNLKETIIHTKFKSPIKPTLWVSVDLK